MKEGALQINKLLNLLGLFTFVLITTLTISGCATTPSSSKWSVGLLESYDGNIISQEYTLTSLMNDKCRNISCNLVITLTSSNKIISEKNFDFNTINSNETVKFENTIEYKVIYPDNYTELNINWKDSKGRKFNQTIKIN